MRNGLSTLVVSAVIAAAAPTGGGQGHDRLVGDSADGQPVVVDEAWKLEGGRIHLIRRTRVAGTESCLEVEADAEDGSGARVAFRREDGATPVAVDAADGVLRVQVGPVAEEHELPGDPVPSSVLRFLPPGTLRGRDVLLESFAVVAPGDATRYAEPGGYTVLAWGAGGVSGRVRTDGTGALVDVDAPALAARLQRVEPRDVPPEGCVALSVSVDDTQTFDTVTSVVVPPLGSPWEVEGWVERRVRYEEDASLPTPDEVLERGRADCVGLALLAGAAARAAGFKVRQVLGTVDGPHGRGWHQWAEVWYRGGWVPVDPSRSYGGRRTLRRFEPTPSAFLSAELLMLASETG